jgi:hypothetical protein
MDMEVSKMSDTLEAVDLLIIAEENGVKISSRVAEGEPYNAEINLGEALVIRYPAQTYWFKISGRTEIITRFGRHTTITAPRPQ